MEKFNPKVFWPLVLVAAAVWVITAVNSHGYYHADEHYQIIEFTGLKLGTHAPEELAWEYKAQSRSSVQPAIVFALFSTLKYLGVTDPYTSTAVLRVLWSLCAFCMVLFGLREASKRLKYSSVFWVLTSFVLFFWFLPFLAARFSSESFSGFLLLLGLLIFIYKPATTGYLFLTGFVLGLSFLGRFQIAFCLLGLGVWLLLFGKLKVKSWLFLGCGFLLSFVAGLSIDYWFYGEFVWSAYNYFDAQIVQDIVNTFGTSPWYFYFKQLLFAPMLPFGVLLWCCVLFLLIRRPKSIWLWCIVPFIIIHSMVPHKEVRFLFPLVCIMPFLIAEGWGLFLQGFNNQNIRNRSTAVLLSILVVPNVLGLMVMGVKSAGVGRTSIMKYFHERSDVAEVQLVHTAWSNPYNPWQSLPTKFYMDDIAFTRFENMYAYSDTLFNTDKESFLSIRKEEVNALERSFLSKDFELVKQSVPQWVQDVNSLYGGLDTGQVYLLYAFKGRR